MLADLAGTDVGRGQRLDASAPRGAARSPESAVRALIFFFIAILLYLTIRLEWRMAVARHRRGGPRRASSASACTRSSSSRSPRRTVIAFLTILGYSIYDTIVVYDKIKENERLVGHEPAA